MQRRAPWSAVGSSANTINGDLQHPPHESGALCTSPQVVPLNLRRYVGSHAMQFTQHAPRQAVHSMNGNTHGRHGDSRRMILCLSIMSLEICPLQNPKDEVLPLKIIAEVISSSHGAYTGPVASATLRLDDLPANRIAASLQWSHPKVAGNGAV